MKIWEKLDQFPPPLALCLARRKVRGNFPKSSILITENKVEGSSGGVIAGVLFEYRVSQVFEFF
jgi:hypothetical protein